MKKNTLKAELASKLSDFDNLQREVQRLREYEQSRSGVMRSQVSETSGTSSNTSDVSNTPDIDKPQIEFCCVSCELIHGERKCPDCGSSLWRIFHS